MKNPRRITDKCHFKRAHEFLLKSLSFTKMVQTFRMLGFTGSSLKEWPLAPGGLFVVL